MRRAGVAGALALLAAGCGSGPGNASNAQAERSGQWGRIAPPFQIGVRLESGNCRAEAGSQAVTGDGLLARGLEWLTASIDSQYTIFGEVKGLPPALIRAGADVPWRCVASAIHFMDRVGFSRLLFDRAGAPPIAFDLQLDHQGIVFETDAENKLAIRADGSFLLNGAPITPERLTEFLRAAAREPVVPRLVVIPDAQARFDALLALLLRVRDAGIELISPDMETGYPLVRFEGADGYENMIGLELYRDELN